MKKMDLKSEATDYALLERARICFGNMTQFRADRLRGKLFTYGDQWTDMIEDRGVKMREEDYIRSQGNIPLKNNLIRRLVRNVLGVYRNRWKMPECGSAPVGVSVGRVNGYLRDTVTLNRLEELYARTMEEFLIGGLAVHKKWFGRKDGRCGCWTDIVSPDRFFFDSSSRDFRGCDVSIIGEIHEMRASELTATFPVACDGADTAALYGLTPQDADESCRVVEVWWKRLRRRYICHDPRRGLAWKSDTPPENADSHAYLDEEWVYTFLSPDGHKLAEGVSPYAHGSHPYVFKCYPFIDGEIHSFVSDIIDQQKLTNRLISMYDWILRASAKGVLLFPEGSLPDGVDIEDVAEEWGRFNGVIVFRPRAGVPLPQQVSSKAADIGITGLLEIQMKMMEDISGVNGALQGKLESNSMSGTLYNQQTQNSLTALADLMKSFDDFTAAATRMDVSNIIQYLCRDASPRR